MPGCKHTLRHWEPGLKFPALLGSWEYRADRFGTFVRCKVCRKFYGRIVRSKAARLLRGVDDRQFAGEA